MKMKHCGYNTVFGYTLDHLLPLAVSLYRLKVFGKVRLLVNFW